LYTIDAEAHLLHCSKAAEIGACLLWLNDCASVRRQWYGSTDDEVVDMMVLDARKGINNGTIVSMKSMTGAKGLASMRCTSQHGCNMVE
jgi:hypothetical protein